MPSEIICRLDGKYIVLTAELDVWVDVVGVRVEVTVEEGFRSDLASIPPWARPLIPVLGPWNKAAVVHDWFYKYPRLENQRGEFIATLTQKQVDKLFLQIMKGCGVSWWRRSAMYRAVRIGGGLTWRKYRKVD